MKATSENIKLSFSIEEMEKLKTEFYSLINDFKLCSNNDIQCQPYNCQEKIKDIYPTISEFLNKLNVSAI